MIKTDDSKLYLYAALICFSVGVILAIIYSYSAFSVEPKIQKLLTSEDNINANLKEAYVMLKDPQIFARYENFDRISRPIKTIIEVYDKRIESKEEFTKDDIIYLQLLLERRTLGSTLTRNTMIFFLILSLIALGFYAFEVKKLKKA